MNGNGNDGPASLTKQGNGGVATLTLKDDNKLRTELTNQTKAIFSAQGAPKKVPPAMRHPSTGKKLQETWTTVERYPLFQPFSYAVIAESPTSRGKVYYVDEVSLSPPEVEVYNYILEALENELVVPRSRIDPKGYFEVQAKKIVMKYDIRLPRLSWAKILYFAERDIVGFGMLDGVMRDPNIEDISVDGIKRPVLVYHRKYERVPTNITFDREEELNDLIARFAHMSGKHISVAFPIMQGILPGGHRAMATFRKEVSPRGGTLSIRKFKEDPITIIDMLNLGVLDHRAAAYMWFMMENRANTIVVGATGAGKTTMLNALLDLMKTNSKIITIEEVQEINLAHQGWTALVSREGYGVTEEGPKGVGLFDLVKAAMRMRPDVLVVGEVRGEEAYVLFQAISTGHGGLCTLHADDAPSAIQRLVSKPMDVPPAFIPFLDIAFTVRRITVPEPGGGFKSIRRVISVDEVNAVGDYQRMFTWDPPTDRLIPTPFSESKKLAKLAADLGISMKEVDDEITRRATVLRWMQWNNLRNFKALTPVLQAYVDEPVATYQRALKELLPVGATPPVFEEAKH
ncbi:MAG: type II/IV secretion system ATPase subunit [Thaumarchaeota archaeon]|nr:type II/IV secretion system ATPase subunit [Nitrososphaerota archaeon]